MSNLLKKTVICGAVAFAMFGCGGDEGRELPFTSDSQIVFTNDAITQVYDEESGVQVVNLLEGATVDGEPLTASETSPIFIREIQFAPSNGQFTTPQEQGFANNQNISPFSIGADGVTLLVDTDAFNSALRTCDTTDNQGATNADGAPIGNGVRDFPTTISYTVTYIIDNGFELPPGESLTSRTLNITLNSIDDPVTSVDASNLEISRDETKPMLSATAPYYSCNPALTYSVEDESIATVDDNGNVTGVMQGETTITVTSVENTDLFATATVNVIPDFNINIVNQEFNALGAPTGTKLVPTCSAIGIKVDPTIIADELQGNYNYAWASDSEKTPFMAQQGVGSFGATGQFANTLAAGETANITVSFSDGYTGVTALADVLDKQVNVVAERNYACDPELNAKGNTFYSSDLGLDNAGWDNAVPVDEGIDGKSLQLTIPASGQLRAVVTQQQWDQIFNYHAATYARGSNSIGREFKFSVWAKLKQLPDDDNDVIKLEHTILVWDCNGCADLPNFPSRFDAGVVGTVTAELAHTTDWQLVEFTNPLTGTNVWSVPAIWDVPTNAFQFWDAYGFDEGDVILLDNYSVVEVN